jgi:phage-related protein
MERLLADAQALTGVEYNIDNLGDVYDAIHAIQGNLGLTGVAASEAAETFSGSFNAMKAAAQNVLGTLALGEDIKPALTGLMGAVNTFVTGNLIPMIGTIIKGLPTVIATFAGEGIPALITKLNGFLANVAKTLTDKANSISAEKVALWAQTMIPKLLAKAGELIGKLAQGLITNIPKIVVAVGKIGLEIVKGLGQAIWPKITAAANTIKDKFLAPINTLREKVKGVIDKIKGFFSFNVRLPHIPLPHFSVSPAGWKLSDLLKGQLPSLGIEWYAKGGIATNPTIAGIGEAGSEAILPLNPFWKKMDEIIDATKGNITVNVYGSPGMNVEELASAVERKIVNKVYRRNKAWGTT